MLTRTVKLGLENILKKPESFEATKKNIFFKLYFPAHMPKPTISATQPPQPDMTVEEFLRHTSEEY
jgi:hypothetical protein